MRYKITVLGADGEEVFTAETNQLDDGKALAWFTKKASGVPWHIVEVAPIRELVVEVGREL